MFWYVPETNVESFYIFHYQYEFRVALNVLFAIKSQPVLALDLGGDSFQAIALQVSPELKNVDNSSTLERFVTNVQIVTIWGSLFMK